MDGDSRIDSRITRKDLADAVRSSAMLVEMSISMWSGEHTDKSVTKKIKEDAEATGNIGRFYKNLLAGCDGPLKTCQSAFNAVRTRHYQMCPPWITDATMHGPQRGPRLLSSALSMQYMKEIGQLRRMALEQLDVFCAAYDALVVEAKANLGKLSGDFDYPAVDEIRRRFSINITFEPIPATASFPNLPDQMLQRLSKTLDQRYKKSAEAAQTYVWTQVREKVSHLSKILSSPDAKFKSASLEHVRSLGQMLPGLNMFGDDRLNQCAAALDRLIDGVDARELRDNMVLRKDVAVECDKLIAKLDDWQV